MNDDNTNVNETTQDAKELKKQRLQEESRLKREIKNKVGSKVKNLSKKAVNKAKAALFKPVTASIGIAIFGGIIVVFMLIGIISFILTMPGMTSDSIFEAISGGLDSLVDEAYGGKDHIINVDTLKNQTIDALKYMDKMGLDPVGLGFVQNVFRAPDENGDDVINGFVEDADSYTNSMKNSNGDLIVSKIPSACPLLSYVLCNERTYLPEEYYIKVDGAYSLLDTLIWEESAQSFFDNITLGSVLYQKLSGVKYVKRTDGMLVYNEDDVENFFSKLEINREDRTMTFSTKSLDNGQLLNKSTTIGLENWVGRYGKPVELLMALHIATMTSDITQEFATNDELDTKVEIEFEDGNYDIDFRIQMRNEDGTYSDLPINFGNTENENELIGIFRKYELVKKGINEDTNKYEYQYVNTNQQYSDYTADSVTICTLKKLIDDFKMNSYDFEDNEEKLDTYSAGLDAWNVGIGEFLNGDKDLYVKYDANLHAQDIYEQLGAYIGTYDEENAQGTGFLSENGTFTFNWGSYMPEGQVKQNLNTGKAYGLTSGTSGYPIQMHINVSSDANASKTRGYRKIHSLQHYFNNAGDLVALNRSTEDQDAITFMMMQIDQYFYRKSNDYSEDKITAKLNYPESNNGTYKYQLTINYGAEKPYIMDISNYNFAINVQDWGAEVTLPGEFTKKWLQLIGNRTNGVANISFGDIQSLRDQISSYYDVNNDIEKNVQTILDGIWCDVVDTEAKECPLTEEDINSIYDQLLDYVKNSQTIKIAYPRIMKVTHHWFKDIDFSKSYGTGSNTIELAINTSEDSKIKATALLKNGSHAVQTSQPYVIKGDVVTLDGEKVDESEYKISGEFGKGYEASKKLLTGGYYYVYDGTEATSNGILYNKLLENVKPGNMVEVRVSDLGSITFMKALDKEGDTFMADGNSVANTNGGEQLGWYVTGETKKMDKSGCQIIHYDDIDKKDANGEKIGETHFYYVYIPESMEYISAVKDLDGAKESAEKINELLIALGVNQLRKQVSFDNQTSEGDVATLTAFSILEGMKSEHAQTIYRDLKEFLIELGYYTKAEFEYLSNNVLEWFIPDYIPEDPEHWQQNNNEDVIYYGAILYPAKGTGEVQDSEGSEEGSQEGEGTEGETPEVEAPEGEGQEAEDQEAGESEESTDDITKGFEPGLDVIAPGNARILEYEINGADSYITLEFDGVSEPQIGMLDKYTMTIKGIVIETNIVDPDDEEQEPISIDTIVEEGTVIKVNTVIGKTGTDKIQVILKNANDAILNNVEDYMHPNLYEIDSGEAYTGSLSQEFYYYLGHVMEGMKYTADEYLTHANGNVSGGGDNKQGYITVGPGLLMDDGKLSLYIQKGGQRVNNRDINSKYRKDIIIEMYIETLDGVYKSKVEELLDGYEVSQNQIEALTLTCYQRGTGSSTLKQIIEKIKQGATADELYSIWVVPYSKPGYDGVFARRYSEWYLYKTGEYIQPYSNSHTIGKKYEDTPLDFGSETPWEDFLNGNL